MPQVQEKLQDFNREGANLLKAVAQEINLGILSGKVVKKVNKLADWFTVQPQGELIALPGQKAVKGRYIAQELDGPVLELHEYFDLILDGTKIAFERISGEERRKKGGFHLYSVSDQSNEQIPVNERVQIMDKAVKAVKEANVATESAYQEAIWVLATELDPIADSLFGNLVNRSASKELGDRTTVAAIDNSDLFGDTQDGIRNYYQRCFAESFVLEYLRGEERKAVAISFFRVDGRLAFSNMEYAKDESTIRNKIVRTQILNEVSELIDSLQSNGKGDSSHKIIYPIG